MLPVGVNVPVEGSYNSAVAETLLPLMENESVPPAINTLPLGSRVAVWFTRCLLILPVWMNMPGNDCDWLCAMLLQRAANTTAADVLGF